MISFEKTHPVIHNERGCAIDRLFLAFLAILCSATAVFAAYVLTNIP